MYYVYADGDSIFNQFDKTLTIHSPKVTLELGKAGSFQFDIPPTNQYYNRLTQLKTNIRVELDNKTIFYGRVFSITRGFNNIKKVYCEGALSYLIDTLQQAKSYKGKAKTLFENIIAAHNAMSDSDKQFVIDRLEIEDTDVIIPGKKDKDGNYYGDKYEQTIIESIAEEWLTTYDYINNVLIEYLGGYLIYKYDGGKNKISYISEDSFDQEIESASSKNLTVPSIDYGINMLDLTEELNAEDLCTVLIPLGDDGLTIEKATNKSQYDDIKIESVDGKGIGIAHKSSVDKYGKIVKSYVFDNVNEANTLFVNGYKYLKAHKNIPISFTVKAVDMHFVNKDLDSLMIGEIAKIDSTPHNIVEYLICTKIEYDLEDASKNTYTFGNPKQSLTERYKKNKQKEKERSSSSSKKSSAKALSTASDIAKAYADEALETINENYATIKNWVEDHYAGIEGAVHFVSTNGEGFVRSTKWVDEYGANTEEVLTWHGKYAESAVSTIKWTSDYSAGIEDAVNWKTRNAEGLAATKKWVDDNSSNIEQTVQWKNGAVNSLASVTQKANANEASITSLTNWKNGAVNSLASVTQKANANEASITSLTKWKKGAVESLASVTQKANDNEASIEAISEWKSGADSSISGIKTTADAANAMASLFATYNASKKTASISLSADSQKSLITILGDKIDARASAVFAKELTAEKIIATAFSAGDYKVRITKTAMSLTNNFRQTIEESANSLIRNLYVGTSVSDDNRVLGRKAVTNLAQTQAKSVIDRKYILNTLKTGETSLTDLIKATLYGESLNLDSGTQIHYDRLYRTLPDFVKKIIDEYVTEDYISNKLSKSTIVGKLSGQTITCKKLLVEVDSRDKDVVTHIYDSMTGHKHGISTNVITIKAVNGRLTNTNLILTNNGTKS